MLASRNDCSVDRAETSSTSAASLTRLPVDESFLRRRVQHRLRDAAGARAKAANDNVVALADWRCKASCQAMGSITPSMQLPFLSCACTGPELSDAETYENFLRMRHNMKVVPALVKALAQTMQWKQVSINVGVVLLDGMSAKRFQSLLRGATCRFMRSRQTVRSPLPQHGQWLKTSKGPSGA